MGLLDDLAEVLAALAPHGWGSLFEKHGLNIGLSGAALRAELDRPLPIDRTAAGFSDFALGGYRAIEPAHPGRSLLYHALASANVHPERGAKQSVYPTLEQLDIVENYIYSRAQARLDTFVDPVISVFAYQYREKERTSHGQHADLAFSRTGIARIGTEPSLYLPELRGFEPRPSRERGFRAMPARYGVFIAERRPQPPNGSVMRGVALDSSLTFLFPVHKLFPGDECLSVLEPGGTVKAIMLSQPAYSELHVNQKLAKIHQPQGGQNPGYVPPLHRPSFDLTKPPFVRTTQTEANWIRLQSTGASVLLEPLAAPLVRTATQSVNGVDEIARFAVPPRTDVVPAGRTNRYWSTLELPALDDSRAAPEYANIRQEVVLHKRKIEIRDLNLAPATEFTLKLDFGGYEAAHFSDQTCDGAIVAAPIAGLPLPVHCAYSLVTAVDYLPRVDQLEIEEWIERRQGRSTGLAEASKVFPQGGPQPMSDGRFDWNLALGELVASRQLPNCTLPHPLDPNLKAFSLADSSNYTATAVVGSVASGGSLPTAPSLSRPPSWLPDGASDVFAPGWDVSQHRLDNQSMYAAYGLGSPFPEDAKLCAALNSFWPAVAPDSARTYGFRPPHPQTGRVRALSTSIPLSDAELGYHPQHPRVQSGEVDTTYGWDGDYGPFIVVENGHRYVNASNPMRADQTRAALDDRLGFNGMDRLDTRRLLQRMEALVWLRREAITIALGFDVSVAWLVTFEAVDDWSSWSSHLYPAADTSLQGEGLIFVFATVGPGVDDDDPPVRKRFPVRDTLEVHLGDLASFVDLQRLLANSIRPVCFARKNRDSFIKV